MNKILILGHRGMVGSACVRAFDNGKYEVLVLDNYDLRTDKIPTGYDLVILAAAKAGGIFGNLQDPVMYIQDNLEIELNVIKQCAYANMPLVFLGSTCIYPKNAQQPVSEDQLLTGVLEPTNKPYAIAKIAGITLCEAYAKKFPEWSYVAVMPTNLYGPGDKYGTHGHVIANMIEKFHNDDYNLKGTGSAIREFLYVDDLAQAIKHMYEKNFIVNTIFNVGDSSNIFTIQELALSIMEIMDVVGEVTFDGDKSKDGTLRKAVNSSKLLATGWKPTVDFKDGILSQYNDYLDRLHK